jgi:hypothetical protein
MKNTFAARTATPPLPADRAVSVGSEAEEEDFGDTG